MVKDTCARYVEPNSYRTTSHLRTLHGMGLLPLSCAPRSFDSLNLNMIRSRNDKLCAHFFCFHLLSVTHHPLSAVIWCCMK